MNELLELKTQLRRKAYDARNAQPNKDEVSRLALAKLIELPEYHGAETVMWYLDCRSELRTRHALPEALSSGKTDRHPYCTTDENGTEQARLMVAEVDRRDGGRQMEYSRTSTRQVV